MRHLLGIVAGTIILFLLSSRALYADGSGFGASCGTSSVGTTVSTGIPPSPVTNSNVTDVGSCGASASNSGTVVELVGEQPFTFQQFAEGSASARASLGVIGAEASAEASSTPASYTFTNANGESEIVTNGFQAQAGAGTSANWFDTFTNPNSDTLKLQLVSVFRGSCTPQCFNGIPPFILGDTTVLFSKGCSSPPDNPFATCFSFFDFGENGSGTVFLDPGAVMQVSADVTAQAGAFSGNSFGNYVPPSSSSANAFDTLGFYINVVGDCTFLGCGAPTPGETYDTASGRIYSLDALNAAEASTTPEPSTLLLLGSGLAGLGVWGRKRLRGV